ncbi:hypothetical protein [Cohnella candidum]|uniref:hypothetical protein n=1 Tax=Cohnella candidum TaxID=2674991 RepID=UPI0013DD8E52|nr:hypothetical protein [Cohnella candidum]
MRTIQSEFEEFTLILKEIKKKIDINTDMTWSGYNNINELNSELDYLLLTLSNKDRSAIDRVVFLFAPTGTFQELSISNGWQDRYLELIVIVDQYSSRPKTRNDGLFTRLKRYLQRNQRGQ